MNAKKLLLVLATVGSSVASGQTFDFKGIALGDSLQKVDAAGYRCVPTKSALGDVVCTPPLGTNTTIAGASARTVSLYLFDDKVSSIFVSFAPSDFTQIALALREKYGAPTSDEFVPGQTRGGVSFTNNVQSWTSVDGSLEIKKYSGSIDRGALDMHTADYPQRFKAKKDAEAKKNSKDL